MISWFEIAVTDIDRAKIFYETVFEIEIGIADFDGTKMGWFPNNDSTFGASGSLIQNSNYVPSKDGALIYFMSNDVQIELDRVEAAGGKVFQKKTKISEEHGCMGVFIDTEGNRIALHSNQ